MKKWWFIAVSILVISCKHKQTDLSGEEPIKLVDFLSIFKPLNLPVTIADTNISLTADTTILTYKALTQFVPNSIINTIVPQTKSLIIHPAGKIEKQNEIYLLLDFVQKKQSQLIAFVFDKNTKYSAYKTLLSNKNEDEYRRSVNINKEPTFLISQEKLDKAKQLLYTKTGWIYNSGNFSVVINDGNEDPEKNKVINPLENAPQKNKLSGDYVIDDKNYISIRDGKSANVYQFYLSFNNSENNCVGELKGDIHLISPTKAVFEPSSDHCKIDFTFTYEEIELKENTMCGGRHGINCSFNNTYHKKAKSKSIKKK